MTMRAARSRNGDGTQGGVVDGGTCTFKPANTGTTVNCVVVNL